MDPRRSNGGVFLGLNGLVIKSHGGADATGYASAIDLGYDMARAGLMDRLARDMSATPNAVPPQQIADDAELVEPRA
jgi:phosphate acyltransferase